MLSQDIFLIREHLLCYDSSSLVDIYILESDRHRHGKQALLFTFASGAKVIFKPTDLGPDKLFTEFVSALHLPDLYDLRCMRALPRNGYGWLEYIPPTECTSIQEVEDYYRRAGVLIAITDSLNYCDGHFDNLIASGPYPVLIDCETLFHSFRHIDSEVGERSILFTGLIQKPPKADSGRGFTAALQTPGIERFEFLHTYAINDHTDDLAVRYRGVSSEVSSNCPSLKGHFQTAHDFIEEVSDGFITAYDHITRQNERILSEVGWWNSVSATRARQLVRHTLYYLLLIRKIQQISVTSCSAAIDVLRPLLHSKTALLEKLVEYEITDLLRYDVPFFYHHPGNCDLYDGNDARYPNYFCQSAVAEIRQRFTERSEAYRDRSVEILRNVLPASPKLYY
jgi:lantibiotic modifying enzyme